MSDNRHGEIVLHQNEDGSVQLRDSLSRFWCACGGAAVHHEPKELPPHDFKCIKCNANNRAVVSDKLQEVKESLSKVTPGEWNSEDIEIWKRGEDYNHEENPHVYIGEILRTENAEFVANAPAYVGWLIEQLEQAQAENEQLKANIEEKEFILNVGSDYNKQLIADKQKLVECLEWYASENRYKANVTDQWSPITPVLEDKGQKAKSVLQEVQHGTSKETYSES